MAQIVEFCGAPGTGKSTLYNEVVSLYNKESNWIPGNYLYPLTNLHYKYVPGFITSLILKKRKQYNFAEMNSAAKRFIEQNKELMDCCWSNIYFKQKKSFNSEDNRFRAAEIWFKIIQKLQVIKESGCSKFAVVDEGIIQRIDSLLYKSRDFEEEQVEIAEIISKIMLPNAIVYIDADVDISISRMKKRKKKLPQFEQLSTNELKKIYQDYQRRWLYTLDLMKEKNIPVLTIDASKEVHQNKKLILEFLGNLKY
jgi:deoxyadenosine/deoxycytidine kinase